MKPKKTTKTTLKHLKLQNFNNISEYFLEKYEVRQLIDKRGLTEIKPFWLRFTDAFGYSLNDLEKEKVRDEIEKKLNNLNFARLNKKAQSKEIRATSSSVTTSIVEKAKFDEKTNVLTETKITESSYITTRKVQSIKFNSEITADTMIQVQNTARLQKEFTEDYIYYLEGGTDDYLRDKEGNVIRKRNKAGMNHLKLNRDLIPAIESLTKSIMEKILDPYTDINELKNYKARLNLLNSIIASARDRDLEPIMFLGGFGTSQLNMQRAVNGAIVNDKMMVENGQIVLDGSEKEDNKDSRVCEEDLILLNSKLEDMQMMSIGNETTNKTIEGRVIDLDDSIYDDMEVK